MFSHPCGFWNYRRLPQPSLYMFFISLRPQRTCFPLFYTFLNDYFLRTKWTVIFWFEISEGESYWLF
jgi:hypothetical protein